MMDARNRWRFAPMEDEMNECTCGGILFDTTPARYDQPQLLICLRCGAELALDDDGHLYDPSDPPGPLWSLSLHDYV